MDVIGGMAKDSKASESAVPGPQSVYHIVSITRRTLDNSVSFSKSPLAMQVHSFFVLFLFLFSFFLLGEKWRQRSCEGKRTANTAMASFHGFWLLDVADTTIHAEHGILSIKGYSGTTNHRVMSVLFVFQFLFFFLFLLSATWNWQRINIFQSPSLSLYLQTPPRNPDLVYLCFFVYLFVFLPSYCVFSKPFCSIHPSIHPSITLSLSLSPSIDEGVFFCGGWNYTILHSCSRLPKLASPRYLHFCGLFGLTWRCHSLAGCCDVTKRKHSCC